MDSLIGEGFLRVATLIVDSGTAPLPEAELRRVISTSYYALFHALSKAFADALICPSPTEGSGSEKAWLEVYRALDHGKCRSACKEINSRFSQSIRELCADLVTLHESRLKADYDPQYRPDITEANKCVGIAEGRIEDLSSMPDREVRPLAIWMLMHSQGTKAVRKTYEVKQDPNDQ